MDGKMNQISRYSNSQVLPAINSTIFNESRSSAAVQRTHLEPMKAVEEILNISHRQLQSIMEFFKSATTEDRNQFLQIMNRLNQKGIVGYEYLDVQNKPYKSFISTKPASKYAHNRLYRGSFSTIPHKMT